MKGVHALNLPLESQIANARKLVAGKVADVQAQVASVASTVQQAKQAKEKLKKGIDKPATVDVMFNQGQASKASPTSSNDSNPKKEEDIDNMALVVISKSILPAPTRGRGASTSPTVSVRENGQFGFNNLAAKIFEGKTHCVVQWDNAERKFTFVPVDTNKLPSKVKLEDCFVIGIGKDEDSKGKKIVPSRFMSGAGLLNLNQDNYNIAYDYKTAGTHSFPAENGNGKLTFHLPKEMAPKPATPRMKKAKGGTAVDMGSGAKVAAPATTETASASDDIDL